MSSSSETEFEEKGSEESLEDERLSERSSEDGEDRDQGSSEESSSSEVEQQKEARKKKETKVGRRGPEELEVKEKGKQEDVIGGKAEQTPGSVAGIVYLSRIPPFMKPHKVKHLLSRYGSVGRVYLKPEDALVRQRRMKFKGNKKRNFTEGWVEFHDKRVAKMVAMMLNNTPIGGKKRSYYHDDLWNIKYLSKFRWTHLTEKIAYEQAVREQKMRTEISQAKRENTHYLASIEKGKEIEAIVERKRKRGATEAEVTKIQRKYKQRKVSETSMTTAHVSTGRSKFKDQPNSSAKKSHLSDSLLKKSTKPSRTPSADHDLT